MESDNKTENKASLARMSKIVPDLDLNLTENDCTIPIDASDKLLKPNNLSCSSLPSSEDEDDNDNPRIPDGGWGWVVVFATFLLCMIADGVTFSFGLLYGQFLIEFEASKSATSWIGSLFMAVPLLTGPIMSALVDKFGCRSMTVLGGLISAAGFILSSKCYSLSLMYLTFGTLAGLGLGLIYVTVVVSVAFWFDKKRTLAVGIGSSGVGIGTFVFSPLTTYFITEYGWRGTTLILGGCFLNMCICGTLMKDPDWIIEQNSQNSKSKLKKPGKSSKESLAKSTGNQLNEFNLEELKSLLTTEKDVNMLLQDLETSLDNNEDTDKLHSCFQSAVSIPTFVREHEKVPTEVLELLSTNRNIYNVILIRYPSLVLGTSNPDKGDIHINNGPNEIMRSASIQQDSWPTHREASNQRPLMGRKNARHEKYFQNLKVDKHSLVHRGALFNTNKYRFKASSCPNIYRVSMVSLPKQREEKWYSEIVDLVKDMFDYSLFLELHFFLLSLSTITLFTWFIVPYFYLAELMVDTGYSSEQKWYSEIVDLVKDMFDYSLFLELHFFLLSLSTITLFTWFIVPYFYLADLMVDTGYSSEQVSFTISNIGISNTIGMIFLGWAGDRSWMNITKAYAIFLVLTGASVAGQMFFIENFIMLQICASLFGISLASHFAFTPCIVMELVPLDRFTIAYGLQLLCQGIGTLVGPPYAGLLFDITHSWEQSFYQAGIWIVLSGIFIGIIPYMRNRKMIGKGSIEKETEDSKNKSIPLVLLFTFTIISFVFVFYLTGKSIHHMFLENSS